jgi:hypothetical protein
MRTTPLLLSLLAVLPVSVAADEQALSGTWEIGGKTLVDPPPGEDQRSHFRVRLTGDAAKALYDTMKVDAVEDECLGDGTTIKFDGGIACSAHPGAEGHECSFAIDVTGRRVESAYSC